MSLPSKWTIGLVLALILGIAFRLAWPGDIEYKQDESYTFTKTKTFVEGGRENTSGEGASRWLGMPTSKGFKNPGMSLWIFYIIGFLSGVGNPTALARGIQLCNVAAILCLLVFAWRCLKEREREWWLWTAAMVCVNPFAVIFERKIWPPCTLPLIMVAFLAGWRSRSSRWGAFSWGLVGILAGQIHMAGFFYAAAFFLWTALYDRLRTAWRWWLAGNLVGVIPMLPWIYYMANIHAHTGEHGGAEFLAWWRLFSDHFWMAWGTEPFGWGLRYFLGGDYGDFMRQPLIGDHATYGVALLSVIAIALGVWMLANGLLRWWKNRGHWRELWKNDQSSFTSSSLQAGFWFFGILATISCIRFERHYLMVAFPLVMLWAARLALPVDATERKWSAGRCVLTALCITNALITFMLMDFIHLHGGAPHGNYGKSYASQSQDTAAPQSPAVNPE